MAVGAVREQLISFTHLNGTTEKCHPILQHGPSYTPSREKRRQSNNIPSFTQRLYLKNLTGGPSPRNSCILLDQCLCLPVHACRNLTHSGGATDMPMPHADAVPHFPVHSLLRDWSYELYAILQLTFR